MDKQEIVEILMRRDGITESEAWAIVENCQEEIDDIFNNVHNAYSMYEAVSEVLQSQLGLESDFIEYFIQVMNMDEQQICDGVDIKNRHYKLIQPDYFQKKYINKQYDELTAISPVILTDEGAINQKGYRSWWLFQCSCGNKICGHIRNVTDTTKSHDCGHVRKQHFLDKYIGQTFNYLTVISLDENYKKDNNIKSFAAYYKCKCKCGNYKTVRITALTSGEVKSCGCLKLEQDKVNLVHGYNLIDLTGHQFGLLTVLYRSEKIVKDGDVIWVCQCQCGQIIERRSSSLRKGLSYSCGCVSMSVGERKIRDILLENNIDFLYDTTYFKDLFTSNNGIGRYDFIILDDNQKPTRLIEFDGKQHFESINYFGGQKYLEKIKTNDNIKNDYAKKHNIPLVRIPYTEINQIYYENLFNDKFLI